MFASEVPPNRLKNNEICILTMLSSSNDNDKNNNNNNQQQQTTNSNKNCNNHKCSLCVKRKRFCLQNVFKLCSCYSSFYIFVNYDYNIMYTARWHAHSFQRTRQRFTTIASAATNEAQKNVFRFWAAPPRCCGKVLIAAAVGAAAATTRPMRPTLLCVFSMYYRKPLLTDPFASAMSSKGRMWNKKSTKKQQK